MARLAIVEVVTETGNKAIAIEVCTENERSTLVLDGATVLDDSVLLEQVETLINYIKDRYTDAK